MHSFKFATYFVDLSARKIIGSNLLLALLMLLASIQSTFAADALLYSRYYGGEGSEYTSAVDTDAAGNIYIIGSSGSAGLATAGAHTE